jgi:hypothetical protein
MDYANGKIYKLITPHDESLMYVGSTCEKQLSKRLCHHRHNYNAWLEGKRNKTLTSFKLLELGLHDVKIVLIESFPCKSKEELFMRERYYIETLDCVNKIIPIRTLEEKKELEKKYRTENVVKIKESYKQY